MVHGLTHGRGSMSRQGRQYGPLSLSLLVSHSVASVFNPLHLGDVCLSQSVYGLLTKLTGPRFPHRKWDCCRKWAQGPLPYLILQDSQISFLWKKYWFINPQALDNSGIPKCLVYLQAHKRTMDPLGMFLSKTKTWRGRGASSGFPNSSISELSC